MHNISINDLAEKIALALRGNATARSVKTENELMKELGIGKDYWSRIKNGTRVLPEEKFVKLAGLCGVEEKVWFHPLTDFGRYLGLSRWEIAAIARTPVAGIDFASRIKDPDIVGNIFNAIEGYWESFYFSVSRNDQAVVSKDLFIVRRINQDQFIECEIIDGFFHYVGWAFPIAGHLYFVLEKSEDLNNEIIMYATNHPDRKPPRLFGVILCVSGGVEATHKFPSASLCAFRYLGSSTEMLRRRKVDSVKALDEILRKEIPTYVDPKDPSLDADTREIVGTISNLIGPDTVPSALRMTK